MTDRDLRTYGGGNRDASSLDVSGPVGEWLHSVSELDAVVWTGLPPRGFTSLDPSSLCTDVVKFLLSLSAEEREGAKEYVQFAPATVRTPVREAIEQSELGWLPKQPPEHVFADDDK